jgi:hypothetical protein
MNASNGNYDQYFSYDTSQLTNTIDNTMAIKVTRDGIYDIQILNIAVTFNGGYTPDPLICYLALNGTQETQYGLVTVAGGNKTSQSGVLFPILNPVGFYQTSIINKISLAKNDSINWTFINGDLTVAEVQRLVVVFRVKNKSKNDE